MCKQRDTLLYLDAGDAARCSATPGHGMVSLRCDANASPCATCHGDSQIWTGAPFGIVNISNVRKTGSLCGHA